MSAKSAGILAFRLRDRGLEVLLVHPGGPYWAHRDRGAWSIPKGLVADGEAPPEAARREFEEETGFAVSGPLLDLGEIEQRGGKLVHAYALEQNLDSSALESNTFTLEWPRGSGRMREFPEVDRGAWFDLAEAREKILSAQAVLLERLAARLRE